MRRSVLTALALAAPAALLAAPAAHAQNWEAGAGLATVRLTQGDQSAPSPEVFVRRRVLPRLALSARVSRAHTARTSDAALAQDGDWYDRRRTSLDVGLHVTAVAGEAFALGLEGGLTHVERHDVQLHSLWDTAIAGSQTTERVLADCATTPGCTARLLLGRQLLSTARTTTTPLTGGYVEAEPSLRLGPVRIGLPVGARYFVFGSEDLTFHAGVRVGAAF